MLSPSGGRLSTHSIRWAAASIRRPIVGLPRPVCDNLPHGGSNFELGFVGAGVVELVDELCEGRGIEPGRLQLGDQALEGRREALAAGRAGQQP